MLALILCLNTLVGAQAILVHMGVAHSPHPLPGKIDVNTGDRIETYQNEDLGLVYQFPADWKVTAEVEITAAMHLEQQERGTAAASADDLAKQKATEECFSPLAAAIKPSTTGEASAFITLYAVSLGCAGNVPAGLILGDERLVMDSVASATPGVSLKQKGAAKRVSLDWVPIMAAEFQGTLHAPDGAVPITARTFACLRRGYVLVWMAGAQNKEDLEDSGILSFPVPEDPVTTVRLRDADLDLIVDKKKLPKFAAGSTGNVEVHFRIDENGRVEGIRGFGAKVDEMKEAVKAVRHWKARPYKRQDKAMRVEAEVVFDTSKFQ